MDPWHAGGVLVNVSDTVVSYMIDKAAHHLDLRSPHPSDPQSVITGKKKNELVELIFFIARQIESKHIGQWISQKQKAVRELDKIIEL